MGAFLRLGPLAGGRGGIRGRVVNCKRGERVPLCKVLRYGKDLVSNFNCFRFGHGVYGIHYGPVFRGGTVKVKRSVDCADPTREIIFRGWACRLV